MIPERIVSTVKESGLESLFVYDLREMDKQINSLSFLPKNVSVFYAMKANPHEEVVKNALGHPNIKGIEVASLGEIEIVRQGEKFIGSNKVIYTGPSKQPYELEYSVENGIKYINIESETEAHRVDDIAIRKGATQDVLLRLNIKQKYKEGEVGVAIANGNTQFGVPLSEVKKILGKFDDSVNMNIKGFHIYPTTGVINPAVLLESVAHSFEYIRNLERELDREFSVLDFGGGFGIDYGGEKKFDIQEYSGGLKELIEEYDMDEKELILELGRYLTADMGYFVTKINDIKAMESGTKALLCCAGTNAHKRPQVLNVDYHIQTIPMNEPEIYEGQVSVVPEDIVNVYGPFCTSVDWLAKDKTGIQARIGDYIVMPQSGAYGKTMSPQHFLSHPEVPEIIVR